MIQKEDILASLATRTVFVVFPKKRTFAKDPSDVDEFGGSYLTRAAGDISETVSTPPTRRALIRYRVNFTREYPLGKCDETMGDLSLIGQRFGYKTKYEAGEFRKSAMCREGGDFFEIYASTAPEFSHTPMPPNAMRVRNM